MNRIILIGNGFDLAHGLKTGYAFFIDKYWIDFMSKACNGYLETLKHRSCVVHIADYEDNFASFQSNDEKATISDKSFSSCEPQNIYNKFCSFIYTLNEKNKDRSFFYELKFKNKFFEQISNKCSIVNWVDIENEYYEALKKLLKVEDTQVRSEKVKKLNDEFDAVKKLLEKYLTTASEPEIAAKVSISNAFKAKIKLDEIAFTKRALFQDLLVESILSHQHISTHPQAYYPNMVETAKETERKKLGSL